MTQQMPEGMAQALAAAVTEEIGSGEAIEIVTKQFAEECVVVTPEEAPIMVENPVTDEEIIDVETVPEEEPVLIEEVPDIEATPEEKPVLIEEVPEIKTVPEEKPVLIEEVPEIETIPEIENTPENVIQQPVKVVKPEPIPEPVKAAPKVEATKSVEAESAAQKQTRAQKKVMKAMSKLNLKFVPGIVKVVMRNGNKGNILFSIHGGEVYKVPGSDTYIVFGEAQPEDLLSRAQMQAAEKFKMPQATQSAPAMPKVIEDDVEDENVDASGVDDKDIELVMQQAGVSRTKAVSALKSNSNDIVNAIMELTM